MKTTKQDLAYWQARHVPRWAPAPPLWEALPYLLHCAINSHGETRRVTSGDLQKHNALVNLRSARARGIRPLRAILYEAVQQCTALQPQRAYTYRRWLHRLIAEKRV